MNFLKILFAVRRIFTVLFSIIKVKSNTLSFAKNLPKVCVPFIFIKKNTGWIVLKPWRNGTALDFESKG